MVVAELQFNHPVLFPVILLVSSLIIVVIVPFHVLPSIKQQNEALTDEWQHQDPETCSSGKPTMRFSLSLLFLDHFFILFWPLIYLFLFYFSKFISSPDMLNLLTGFDDNSGWVIYVQMVIYWGDCHGSGCWCYNG